MYLEFSYPFVRQYGEQTEIRHCDIGVNLRWDTTLGIRRWEWFGCVCHRPAKWPKDSDDFGLTGRQPCSEGFGIPKTRPCEDKCQGGTPNPSECGPLQVKDLQGASLASWDGFCPADKRK